MHTAKTEQLQFDISEGGVLAQLRLLVQGGDPVYAFDVQRENIPFTINIATCDPLIREVRVFSLGGDEIISTVPIEAQNTWAFGQLPHLTGGKRLQMFNLQPLGRDGRAFGPAVRIVIGTTDRIDGLPHVEIPMPRAQSPSVDQLIAQL